MTRQVRNMASGLVSWTDERLELAERLWKQGRNATEIATQLGGTTRNAVLGKVHRLGWSRPEAMNIASRSAANQRRAETARTRQVAEDWSDEHIIRLRILHAEGRFDAETADLLNAEFGTGYTTKAIAARRHRLGLRTDLETRRHNRKRAAYASKPKPEPMIRGVKTSGVKPPSPTPLRAEPAGLVTLLTLGAHMCKWPIGEPDEPTFSFCGRKAAGSYCEAHSARAYVTPKSRTEAERLADESRRAKALVRLATRRAA